MEKYKTVTDIIKAIEPDRDWEMIARKYAKKYNGQIRRETGKDPETNYKYWLDFWKSEREFYRKKGNFYHSKKEQESKGSRIAMGISEEQKNKLKTLNFDLRDREFLKLKEGDDYAEMFVWLNSAKLVGQPDRVYIKNGEINIIDYKAFKELKKEAHLKWDNTFERLKAPVAHLAAVNFVTASLQVNIYAYILKSLNPKLKIGKLQINHLEIDKEGNLIKETIHDCPDLQKEVKSIIKQIRENKL